MAHVAAGFQGAGLWPHPGSHEQCDVEVDVERAGAAVDGAAAREARAALVVAAVDPVSRRFERAVASWSTYGCDSITRMSQGFVHGLIVARARHARPGSTGEDRQDHRPIVGPMLRRHGRRRRARGASASCSTRCSPSARTSTCRRCCERIVERRRAGRRPLRRARACSTTPAPAWPQFITVGHRRRRPHRPSATCPRATGSSACSSSTPSRSGCPTSREHPDSFGFPPHHPPMRSFLGVPIRAARRGVREPLPDRQARPPRCSPTSTRSWSSASPPPPASPSRTPGSTPGSRSSRSSRTASGSPATCTTPSSSGCSPPACRCRARRRLVRTDPDAAVGPHRERRRRPRRHGQAHPHRHLRARAAPGITGTACATGSLALVARGRGRRSASSRGAASTARSTRACRATRRRPSSSPTLREALSNVARHAQAHRASSRARRRRGRTSLRVVDDGVGPPDGAAPRQRAAEHGGASRSALGGEMQLSARRARRRHAPRVAGAEG